MIIIGLHYYNITHAKIILGVVDYIYIYIYINKQKQN